MENRAYAFAFMVVLGIICLGAYVAVSALLDTGGDPIIRFDGGSTTPTPVPVTTRAGTRTPTPTNTPNIPVIPTIIFPTATPVPPTNTPTLRPFPTPALIPTRTPTPVDTPPPVQSTALPPPPGPTNTPTADARTFQYRVDSGPAVDRTRRCSSGVYIYGFVRDAQNNPLPGVRVKYGVTNVINPPAAVTEAKGYELFVRSETTWYVLIVDNGDRPLSPTVNVRTPAEGSGECWVKLDWKRN